jgi:hypothetical protein
MTKLRIEPGQRFGRLTVIAETRIPRNNGRQVRAAICQCGCGNPEPVTVWLHNLLKGRTQSCGCLQSEVRRTHGLGKHQLYPTWYQMVLRCSDKADEDHLKIYYERGIRVCPEWNPEVVDRELAVTQFIADIEQHLGPRPEGKTLDRIDNDGDYQIDNLRWADALTQNRNRPSAKLTPYRQEIKELYATGEWTQQALADKYGVSISCINAVIKD